MATLTETLQMLRELKWSGVLSTTYEGKRVEYRSMDELDRAIADVERQIDAAAGRQRPGARRVTFRRAGR